MNLPGPIQSELDRLGGQNAERAITRAEAVTALRDVILRHADSAFLRSVVAEFAGRALDSWHKQHSEGSRTPAPEDQSELFPGLPVRLFIRPGVRRSVILFTGHDWDMARNMLQTRTDGAKKAAERDQAAFDAAYEKVRPLLSGELTTADVAGQLDSPGLAASP